MDFFHCSHDNAWRVFNLERCFEWNYTKSRVLFHLVVFHGIFSLSPPIYFSTRSLTGARQGDDESLSL